MIDIEVDSFLDLPDWRKIKLRSMPKYHSYPLMTPDQRQYRQSVLIDICKHFAPSLEEDETLIFSSHWPKSIELFLTPKLLDVASIDLITAFGRCSCCVHYNGYTSPSYQRISTKAHIVPISGVCSFQSKKKKTMMTRPDSCCSFWYPQKLYSNITYSRIHSLLQERGEYYKYSEYLMDLNHINLLIYFFNT